MVYVSNAPCLLGFSATFQVYRTTVRANFEGYMCLYSRQDLFPWFYRCWSIDKRRKWPAGLIELTNIKAYSWKKNSCRCTILSLVQVGLCNMKPDQLTSTLTIQWDPILHTFNVLESLVKMTGYQSHIQTKMMTTITQICLIQFSDVNILIEFGGQTLHKALPLTIPWGTGP